MITSEKLNELYAATVQYSIECSKLWHTWSKSCSWESADEFTQWLCTHDFSTEDIIKIIDELELSGE